MSIRQQTPQIRFTGFSEDWTLRPMEDFGSSVGGTSLESEFAKTGKYKVISIGSYSKNSTYTDQGIRASENEKTKKKVLNKNDLAMVLNDKTLAGNIIGRALLIDEDEKYVFNQRTQRLILDQQKYYPKFMYQMLNADNIREKIVKSSQGNTQIYVNWSGIKHLKYTLPNSMQEQIAIGNFFQNIDQTIALQRRKHEQTQTLKQSLLSKMFPKKGQKQPEIRLAGFSGDWVEIELGGIGDFNPSGVLPDNFNYVDLESVSGTKLLYSRKESREQAPSRAQRLAKEGDLFYQAVRPYQKNNYLFNLHYTDFVFSTGYIQIRPYISSDFLLSYIQKDSFVYDVLKECTGTSYPAITTSSLKKIIISTPLQSAEQTAIGQFFKQLDDTLSLQAKQLKTLENLKQALLAKMFV